MAQRRERALGLEQRVLLPSASPPCAIAAGSRSSSDAPAAVAAATPSPLPVPSPPVSAISAVSESAFASRSGAPAQRGRRRRPQRASAGCIDQRRRWRVPEVDKRLDEPRAHLEQRDQRCSWDLGWPAVGWFGLI